MELLIKSLVDWSVQQSLTTKFLFIRAKLFCCASFNHGFTGNGGVSRTNFCDEDDCETTDIIVFRTQQVCELWGVANRRARASDTHYLGYIPYQLSFTYLWPPACPSWTFDKLHHGEETLPVAFHRQSLAKPIPLPARTSYLFATNSPSRKRRRSVGSQKTIKLVFG